jgi:7,8-dihydro-6-hydroxymethylpterin-pyrophosphokinase
MLQRRFVLTPLAELAPKLKHPAWDAPVAVLLERVTDPSQVRHF